MRNEWWTPAHPPQRFVSEREIVLDAAACSTSRLVSEYLGLNHPDPASRYALAFSDWHAVALAASECPRTGVEWLNRPYLPSKTLGQFLARAVATAQAGTDVVVLVASATGTRWWWYHVVDPDAQVEFSRGRLALDCPHSVTATVAPRACDLISWVPTPSNADPSGVCSRSPVLQGAEA